MATADRILQLKLVTDATSATKGVKTVQKDMTRLQTTQGRVTSGFKSMGLALGALGAVSIGADILKGGIEDFFAAEKAAADFERQIAGTSTNVPRDMKRMADAMERALSVNVDDTEFQNAVTGIIRQLRVNVPRAIRVAELAADLVAAGVFPDFASAVKGITGALQGKKRALVALGLPTNKVMKDSRILEQLERKYGEAAEENAATLPGRWKQLQLRFDEFVEEQVASAFDLSDQVATALTGAAGPDWVGTATGLFRESLGAVATVIVEGGIPIIAGAQAIGTGTTNALTVPVKTVPAVVEGVLGIMKQVLIDAAAGIIGEAVLIGAGIFNAIDGEVSATDAAIEGATDDWKAELAEVRRGLAALRTASNIPLFGRSIPGFAEGGIVTRPTVALIGERGPEAVVPLTGPHAGGMGITVNISAGVGDPVEIGRQVDRVLRAYRGRAGLAA